MIDSPKRVQIGWWTPGLRGEFSDHLTKLMDFPIDAFVDRSEDVVARPVYIDVGGEFIGAAQGGDGDHAE